MRVARLSLLVCLSLCAIARSAAAADYYIAASGSDANAGSAAAPWQTLARASSAILRPGDRVLLRGGDSFSGTLSLDASDAGTAAAPIVIGSYGTGRATIRTTSGAGISVYNTSGVSIAGLAIVGGAGSTSGISVFTDLGGYSVLQAESKEALAASLKEHPHFTMPDGFIDIVELMQIPGM